MSYYTGLVLLYFIFWLVVRLYRGPVDFTWWPINSHDEDDLKEEMEDYVESNRLSVLANVTPEVKSVVISLVTLGIFIFNLINAVGFYLIIQVINMSYLMYYAIIVVMILAIIDAVESTYDFYFYFASMVTKNVPTKIIYRYLDIYRIKLLLEYMDEVLCALSILGQFMGYIVTLLFGKKNTVISNFLRCLIFATCFTITVVKCLYVAVFIVKLT